MTEPCMFPNLHEPFYCRIHADVRLRLTDERCRRGVTLTQPQPDAGLREAVRGATDALARAMHFVTCRNCNGGKTVPCPVYEDYIEDAATILGREYAVSLYGEKDADELFAYFDWTPEERDALRAALRSAPAAPKEDDRA